MSKTLKEILEELDLGKMQPETHPGIATMNFSIEIIKGYVIQSYIAGIKMADDACLCKDCWGPHHHRLKRLIEEVELDNTK